MQYFGYMSLAGTTDQVQAALIISAAGETGDALYLAVDGQTTTIPVTVKHVIAPIGNSNWRIELSTGDILHLSYDTVDDNLQALFPKSVQRSAKLGRLENIRWRGIVILAFMTLAIGYGFRLSIAPLGDLASKAVSIEMSNRISTLTLDQLDFTLFDDSELTEAQKQEITTNFDSILAYAPAEFQKTRLHFRKSPLIGPNAFALAGNDVVLLDEMVSFVQSGDGAEDETDEQARLEGSDIITAVLAHELGHVINRHAIRQIMRSVVFTLGVSVVIGADESVVEEMAALGGSFILAKYAQEFELEADQVSARIMREIGKDPALLATFFDRILASCENDCDGGGFLSSHPSFDQRIDAISQ